MSGADALRTAIADLIREFPGFVHGEAYAEDITDSIVEKVLADPVRRLAILSLVGDVHVGYARFFAGEPWTAHSEPTMNRESVYLVRPRGEATDAD